MKSPIAVLATTGALLAAACTSHAPGRSVEQIDRPSRDGELVRCVLPPQIRQLGTDFTYLSASRVITTSAADCEIRGGSPRRLGAVPSPAS